MMITNTIKSLVLLLMIGADVSNSRQEHSDGGNLFWQSKIISETLGLASNDFVDDPLKRRLQDHHEHLLERTTPGIGCLRFATMNNTATNGLGHRVLDLALLFEFSARLNATPLIEDAHFLHTGRHGQYSWFPTFAGLSHLDHKNNIQNLVSGLRHKFINEWDIADYTTYSNNCHVIFEGCDHCCSLKGIKNRWCTDRPFPHAVNRLALFLRPQFEGTVWGTAHRFASTMASEDDAGKESSCINIIVHIRVGDINLGCGGSGRHSNFAKEALSDVLLALNDPPCVVVQYLSEAPINPECVEELTDKEQLQQSKASGILEVNMLVISSPMQSLWQMLLSDILIGSGSSFSLVAAVLSRWVTYIAPVPKEGSYIFLTVDDELRYNPQDKFSRPFHTNGETDSELISHEEAGEYICNRIHERRDKNLCFS